MSVNGMRLNDVHVTDIGWAMARVQEGHVVSRRAWVNGLRLFLAQNPVILGHKPVLLIRENGRHFSEAWIPTVEDLLANDWVVQ
jgi:hypothetical protein